MEIDLAATILAIGLVLTIALLAKRSADLARGVWRPSGAFGIVCGVFSVLPFILIKVDLIDRTLLAVGLGIAYFLVLIIGSAILYWRANATKHM